MASLKEMRGQISSVKATQKITKAMQMVAAAKLRRAQDAAESARPYALRMASVIANLSSSVSGASAPALLAGHGKDDKHLVVVATGDRGLAGGFNSNIARLGRDKVTSLIAAGKDVKIICIGRKGRDQLRRLYASKIIATYEPSSVKVLTLDFVQPIATQILDMFESGEVDVVTLVFSHFKSVISQVPSTRQLIPAQVEAAQADEALVQTDLKGAVYTYEPNEESILETLLPRNLAIQILAALLENQAGFFAAQMSAMDNATRNAGDMISSLTLKYNRSRQAQITKELIEIISGAEAL